jgi:hypothetical protein
MRTGLHIGVALACLWTGTGTRAFAGQSAQDEMKAVPAPSGIQLLEGYQHRSLPSLDTTNGVVWKNGGPRIDYEIGALAPLEARDYRQTHKSIWRTTVKVSDMPLDFVLDADQDVLVATIGYANFTATGVKSRRDLSEVMVMIMTYDVRKGR